MKPGNLYDPATMPCWYFDRKQIKNSPSFLDGIDTNTENRYRREGARFIIDAGTKMGLRWDTCATGVIYFHRFYMFHSFKEFYRYVTAACCLFLAGKVEETPKKCKDIIKIAQSLLSSSSFTKFGDDPREEVMTMERILLKTIKFDFQVQHPYSYLLKYAKNFKCEKEKIQNMAQMAWTFINDSLCTTLSLQWEPEIVCVSLMYLASRLTKFEPGDWTSKSSSRSKWWEDWLEGMSMELMEDICHQVLDLYSNKNKKAAVEDSPPVSPSKSSRGQSTPPPPPPPDKPPPKRTREVKSESEPPVKSASVEKEVKPIPTVKSEADNSTSSTPPSAAESNSVTTGNPIPVAQHIRSSPSYNRGSNSNSYYNKSSGDMDSYSAYNPYVSSRMFSASFMSQEGAQNIQSILAGNSAPKPVPAHSYSEPRNHPAPHHGPPDTSQYPSQTSAPPPSSHYPYLPPPSQNQYEPPSMPPPHSYPTPNNPPPGFDHFPRLPPNNQTFAQPSSYAPTPPVSIAASQHSYIPPSLPQSHYSLPPPTHLPLSSLPHQGPTSYHPPPNIPPFGAPSDPHPNYGGVSRNYQTPGSSIGNARKELPALTDITISGRTDWNMNR